MVTGRRAISMVDAQTIKRSAVAPGLDGRVGVVQNPLAREPWGYLMTFSGRLDATLAAFADPTRRAIVARLAAGAASVTDLAKPFAMSQPAISKHLKAFERAGLISRGRDAQRRPCKIEGKPPAEATRWLERYQQIGEGNFQRLNTPFDELKTERKNEETPNAKSDSR